MDLRAIGTPEIQGVTLTIILIITTTTIAITTTGTPIPILQEIPEAIIPTGQAVMAHSVPVALVEVTEAAVAAVEVAVAAGNHYLI